MKPCKICNKPQSGGYIICAECAVEVNRMQAEIQQFREAAAEYGIDAQTMLTLARSQIATAKENAELREAQRCEWFETDNDQSLWQCNACQAEWTLEAGNPIENDMSFCPHCGRRITAINELEWHDDDEEWGYKQTILPDPPQKGE